MNRIAYETRRALVETERDLGCPLITWDGIKNTDGSPKQFPCVPFSNALGKLFTAAGYSPTGGFNFIVRQELFIDASGQRVFPDVSDYLTGPGGEPLAIRSLNKSPDGMFVLFDCVDRNSGA